MATMLHLGRPTALRLVLLAALVLVTGILLSWSVAPTQVHTADAPATPGNEMLAGHPWGDRGCTLPGAAIDSVAGLFDFRHACTHQDGCYQGLDRMGDPAVVDRLRCDTLFRTDLVASCAYLHGVAQNWRARECESTADAYYAVARSFGRPYYTGGGDPS